MNLSPFKKNFNSLNKKELKKYLSDFYLLYRKRPIKNNKGGMLFGNMFGLYYFLRKIKPQLLKTVKKFREDELEHHDTGVEHQAEMTTGYVLLSKTIKQLCYTAIKISKKY